MFLTALCLLMTFSVVYWSNRMVRSPLKGIENQLVDLSFQVRTTHRERTPLSLDQIVIIDIDDASIERLGRTQFWPRAYDAQVIRYINSGSPLAIGIDYLYTESDSLPSSYRQLLRSRGVDNISTVMNAMSTDHELGEAIAEGGNVYLSFYDDNELVDSLIPDPVLDKMRLLRSDSLKEIDIPELTYPILPIDEFTDVAAAVGSIAMPSDQDGTVRTYRALQEIPIPTENRYYAGNFPFYMLMDAYGLGADDVHLSDQGIAVGDKSFIPLRKDGTFRINWLSEDEEFRYISYYKVLEGMVPAEFFAGKFVFFGTSASGLQDLKTVPVGNDKMPGVEVHAVAFMNMVNQDFITEMDEWATLPYFALISLIMVALFLLLRPLFGFVVAVILIATEMFGFFLYFMPTYNIIFPVVTLMLLTLLAYLSSSLYIYFIRERKSRRLKNAFGTYVSPEVVEQISRDSSSLHLGGERKELTVLFSDIRGFTSYSEKMQPEQIVAVLNDYLSRMSAAIFKHKGTIDKFIGDAIMAIFGAPIPQADHATRACKVALDMVRELKVFNDEQIKNGGAPLSIGIGINTGDMTVGNIGSEKRFDYTVIGDSVNLGSRLEGLTKMFGVNIIVSEFTYEKSDRSVLVFRELASVIVKGRDNAVNVYELRGDTQAQRLFVEQWDMALKAFKQKDFEHARRLFEAFDNDLAAKYYVERCHEFEQKPEEFTLTLKMESK